MEKRLIRPKLLIILVGLLLIAGAVAVAASFGFGGAKLLTAEPVMAQPPAEESLQQDASVPAENVILPGTGPTGPGLLKDGAVEDPAAPYQYDYDEGGGCGHETQMNPEDL